MADELKPCPFCGGAVDIDEIPAHAHSLATWMPDHPGSASVECHSCGTGMLRDTIAEAVAAWNRRATVEPPTEAQIDAEARRLFELDRVNWVAPEYSQHEHAMRERARALLAERKEIEG